MKKIHLPVILLSSAVLFLAVACHISGTSYSADDSKGYAEAIKLLQRNIDTTMYKIYEMKFETSQPQGNKLETVTVKMVSDGNKAYSQKIMLTGAQVVFPTEAIPRAFDSPVYTEVKGIDLSTFNAKQIEEQINKAKKLIPKENKFQAVYDYCITETVPTATELDNGFSDWGQQRTTFNLSFTQTTPDGKKGFVEVRVVVEDDGNVRFDID